MPFSYKILQKIKNKANKLQITKY